MSDLTVHASATDAPPLIPTPRASADPPTGPVASEIDFATLTSEEGWALGPIVRWLVAEGRRYTQPTRLADALCRRLVDAGAPMCRMRFSFHIIHPQIAACAFTWIEGRNSTEFCLLHEDGACDGGGTPVAEAGDGGQRSNAGSLAIVDPELQQLVAGGGVDYLVVPLMLCDGSSSALSIATESPRGFSAWDKAKFHTLGAFLAPILDIIATRRLARILLDTYVGHRAGSRVLDGLIKRGDGERIDAVIWYSDLRDFTLLTETMPAAVVLNMLNVYFERVAAAVAARGGEVLRFVGDAMLIIFPVEKGESVDRTCAQAVAAADQVFAEFIGLNRGRRDRGEPEIRFGVGLHVGEVIFGNVGAPDRLDFTVMGPAVNRAARLENLTKVLHEPLLLSAEMARHITQSVCSLGYFGMKGVARPQEVFRLPANETGSDQVDGKRSYPSSGG